MAFQQVNVAGIAPIGNPGIRNLVQSLAQGYQAGHLPKQLAQEDEQRDLANQLARLNIKYKPQEVQSELALRQAQLQNAQNQAALNKVNVERMLAFRNLLSGSPITDNAAQLAQNLNASQAQSPMMRTPSPSAYGVMRPDLAQPQPQPARAIPDRQPSQAIPTVQPMPSSPSLGAATVLNEGDPRLRRIDSLYANNPQYRDQFDKMGFSLKKQIKQSPETGQVFVETSYPSGRIEVQSVDVGKSPRDVAFDKGVGESDAKVYQTGVDAIQKSQDLDDNLDYISNLVNENPNFKNIAGPISAGLTKWAGNPKDRELLGNINTATGKILLDAAKSIKGAFNGRDYAIINSVKPSINDFPDVFIGKLKAMKILNKVVEQRNSLITNYIRNGMSPTNAIARARKETDLSKITNEINDAMKPKKFRGLRTNFQSQQDFQDYMGQLSPAAQSYLRQQMLRGS